MERQRWLVAALVGASLAWLWLLAGCAGARLSPVAPTPALCTGDSIDGDCASVAGTQEPPSLQVMAAAPVQRAPADERYLGALDAPVVLIEYGDYQWPYCRAFARGAMPSLIEKYVKTGKLRIIFRDFPVPSHTSAVRAAHAAHCAADQGRYWDMHDKLFANADKLGGTHDADFALFRGFAQDLGLDVEQYMGCMESRKYLDRITEDVVNARAMNITGTPTYILNGELLFGLYPGGVWDKMIEARLNTSP